VVDVHGGSLVLRRIIRRTEIAMARMIRSLTLIASLVMLVNVTPSWGQPVCVAPGCNPTVSDTHGNAAGGSNALIAVVPTPGAGVDNTAFGDQALSSNTSGALNTAIGTDALKTTTTAHSNTAIGAAAMSDNIGGNENTAIGAFALGSTDTGSNNTASGVQALSLTTSGSDNTASGRRALLFNGSGLENSAFGSQALINSTGNKNIGIGFKAGKSLTSGNNNIFIGHQGVGPESQTIRIGTAQTRTFIAGFATPVTGAALEINTTTGQIGTAPPSSARYKQDIEPMGTSSAGVLRLHPVTFSYRDDTHAVRRYGLIAEEVEAVYPQLVTYTPTGELQGVRYQELIPILLNELQHEHQARQQESAKVAALETQLAALQALVAARLGQSVAQDGSGESMR